MIFKIYLSRTYRTLWITTGDVNRNEDDYRLIAERDPDQPITFRTGYAYFNPLLKNKVDSSQLFYVLEDQLLGFTSGRPPALPVKDRKGTGRGWFEIIKESLTAEDIPPDIRHQFDSIPKLTGVLAQILRTRLGVSPPVDFKASGAEDWLSWLYSLSLPVTPSIKLAFGNLLAYPQNLVFASGARILLLTGQVPEPKVLVQARKVELRTVTALRQEIYESNNFELAVPARFFNEPDGVKEFLAQAASAWGEGWDKIGDFPVYTSADQEVQTKIEASGYFIFYRPSEGGDYKVLSHPGFELPGRTINQIFDDAIIQQETP